MPDPFSTQTTTPLNPVPPGLFGQTVQNIQGFGNPYQMSAPQWASLGNLVSATNAPRPDPASGNPAWQGYLTNAASLRDYQGGFSPSQVSGPSIPSATINWGGEGDTTATYNPVSVAGQPSVRTAQIDPTAAYNAAANQLRTFATPQVRAAMQAAGLGRSGATGEAIGRAAASLELPINMQVLASQAAANQLDAQIAARQGETEQLAQLQASLQAQRLTATSAEEYQRISAQLATVQAQLQQSAMNLQGTLGMQAQIANQGAGMQQYQTDVGAGVAGQNQLSQLAQAFPGMYNQHYLTGLAGANAQLQGVSMPQGLDIANLKNQQDFLARLLGQSGATTTQDPGLLGYLGAGAQGLGALGPANISALGSLIGSGLGAIGSGLGGAWDWLTGPPEPYNPIDPNFVPEDVTDWGWY
jgi:hypothetical protein